MGLKIQFIGNLNQNKKQLSIYSSRLFFEKAKKVREKLC